MGMRKHLQMKLQGKSQRHVDLFFREVHEHELRVIVSAVRRELMGFTTSRSARRIIHTFFRGSNLTRNS